MTTLKYTIIRNKVQYRDYTRQLESLVSSRSNSLNKRDEIALLTLLIEKWDNDHNDFNELDPVQLLQSFMSDHQMKAKDLVGILGISKGYVSDILHYKKGLSKQVIRNLASHFKVSQEAFNRPYKIISGKPAEARNAGSRFQN